MLAWVGGCYTGTDFPPLLDQCATDGVAAPAGAWDTDFEDWRDPGQPGNDEVADACSVPEIIAHHCFSTPVHAVHMHTGDVLVMHGESDQRLWTIGTPPSAISWHPVPFNDETPPADAPVVDLCCAGHSQLPSGEVLFAGGNIKGSPNGGGIRDTFRFDPSGALGPVEVSDGDLCPFGWDFELDGDEWVNRSGSMAYDRWYPTLTSLPNGHVLIAGGTSRTQAVGGLCDAVEDCDGEEICNLDLRICQPVAGPCPLPDIACQDNSECTAGVCRDGECRCALGESCYGATNTCQPPAPNAETTRVLEVYDPSQPPESAITQIAAPFPATEGVPSYPFMFVLPNGDVLYAGAEAIVDASQVPAQILVVDYDNILQSEWGHTINSTITGGSAVMYRPGQVLKTGGRPRDELDSEEQTNVAEVVDLRGFASGDYGAAPTEFSIAAPMNSARHFHNSTLLPDGRVLVTGGNEYGNSQGRDHFNNPCEVPSMPELRIEARPCAAGCPSVCMDWSSNVGGGCVTPEEELTCSLIRNVACLTDATCEAVLAGSSCESESEDNPGFCTRGCAAAGDVCGYIDDCGPNSMFASPRDTDNCGALNHACYASKVPEIWDPQCNTWTDFPADPETFERMYHSTALLLPDARVISMGNGHRQLGVWQNHREGVEQQYFAPQYAEDPAAPAPEAALYEFGITLDGEPPPEPVQDYLAWGGTIDIIVENDVRVRGGSLVRLGSVTHGFDMDQRWLPLITSGQGSPYRVQGGFANSTDPFDANTAPPGWYMLFLLSDEGEPGDGIYVRVGDGTDVEYVCEASELLAINEVSCESEPDDAACPSGNELSTGIDLPTVLQGSALVEGFRVIVPAGMVEDHDAPTSQELAAVESVCARACTDHIAGRVGYSANCEDSGVFSAVTPEASPGDRATELIRADHRHGEDLFGTAELTCDLVTACHEGFDEVLDAVGPRRVTPAAQTLGESEEWVLSLTGSVAAMSTHSQGQVSASMTGEIGYSLCQGGNASGPCPFYLGSLDLELTQPLTLVLQCDGQPETHVLSSLSLSLAQPAFGIAQQGTVWRGFPPGALVFDAEGVVDGLPFTSRRPTQEPVFLRAGQGWSMLQGIDGAWLEFTMPCGEDESADVLVWWGYNTIAVDEHPPAAEITVPATVPCPSTVNLTASVSDVDGDLATKRWLVDGVLMEHGITQLHFTEAHELTLVVTDERGATTSDVEAKVCQ